MSFFDQYSGTAGQAADQYGIPQPVFFGLIQQESSWNPFASPGTTSAYGFTQLTNAAASSVGANQFDPTSNLFGGAQYLASMPGSTWTEKLAHYFQGPNATINSSGLAYAQGVLNKAKQFLTGGGTLSDITSGAGCLTGDPAACASLAGGLLGGGDGCGTFDFICKLQKWISQSEFFTRLALAALALLLVLGGLYLMKGKE